MTMMATHVARQSTMSTRIGTALWAMLTMTAEILPAWIDDERGSVVTLRMNWAWNAAPSHLTKRASAFTWRPFPLLWMNDRADPRSQSPYPSGRHPPSVESRARYRSEEHTSELQSLRHLV